MGSDITRSWIVANFAPMVVAGILMVAAFLLRKALGVTGADASSAARTIFVGFEMGAAFVYMALYARMTGAVLRRIIPDLPRGPWLVAHLAIGVFAGAALGLLMLEPDNDDPIDWVSWDFLVIAVVMTVGGLLLGAAFGGVQAAVLRRVADRTRFWMPMTAVAMGVGALAAVVTLPFEPNPPTLISEMANAILFTLTGVIVAIIMLPALRRLEPRAG